MDGQKKSGKPKTPAERRQLRLEEQLRANLQRRKAQARARRDDGEGPAPEENADGGVPSDLPQGPRSD